MVSADPSLTLPDERLREIEGQILLAQAHTQRVLLKATEMLLKRPGRLSLDANDLRYLVVVLANPLLGASFRTFTGRFEPSAGAKEPVRTGPVSGHHSGIIKRIPGTAVQFA